jgi:uncharacterized protein (DUF885 family)
MFKRISGVIIFLLFSLLVSGCGRGASVTSITHTPTSGENAAVNNPPSLPTNTLLPTTEVPLQPSNTPSPAPTETPLPSETPEPEPPSVAQILTSLEKLPFNEFMDESYRQLQLRDPDNLFMNGYADLYGAVIGDQFTDLSPEYSNQTQELESGILEFLTSYNRESLSYDQCISYDAYEWYLEMRVRGHEYADFKLLVNPVWGLQDLPVELLNELPLETQADAELYIARLANIHQWGIQVVDGLKRVEQAGALPPRFVIEDTITLIDDILKVGGQSQPDASILDVYTHFQSEVYQISELTTDEQDALVGSALKEVEESFIPAYLSMRGQLETMASQAVEDPDDWHLPGGEDYYSYLLEYYTGTKLNADEIHALALAEVSRLQDEIRKAADELGYPAGISMAELNQRISEDSEMITGNALKQKYEQLISAADRAADDYFGLRAKAQVVTQVDMDAPPAFYMLPPPGSSDPGVMVINPGINPMYANYNEYVLVHHETIPGHHTQLALAQELDLPSLQRYYAVNPYLQEYILQAFPEGWAFYSETLAWEMGLYGDDTLANLGRLRLHLLRATRSVVDTGIHAMGWTVDQAAAYLEEVTGMPQNRSLLSRYITNPGYPNGYNMAAIKIFELRQKAMYTLGEKFDIREFHDVILGHGTLPIGVLETVVNDWIAAMQIE